MKRVYIIVAIILLVWLAAIVKKLYFFNPSFKSAYSTDWQIVEVNTKPFYRKPFNGPPEIQLNLGIRNISEREMFVWGQDFGGNHKFYLVESLIKDSNSDEWERQNVGMCGSIGRIGWIRVDPGETISVTKVLFEKYAGRQMILTFRCAYSEGDKIGAEVFLDPFRIPEAKESEQSPEKDSLEAAGFTEEVLTHAFESGCALVVVRVSSVRGEKDKHNTIFYYYQTHVLHSIIDGDFITKDLNDSLDLYAGASYGKALTPGSVYALFIIRDAQYFWAIRNAAIKVDSVRSPLVAYLSEMAARIYAATDIIEFRKPAIVDNLLPELPEQLLLQCQQFRGNLDKRVEIAKSIAESDLGSQLDRSRPWSSVHIYEKPKIILSRSQALSLLGEPTLKSGRNYFWYCGKDSSIDRPGEWVGVISIVFDRDAKANTLRYLQQEKRKWRED